MKHKMTSIRDYLKALCGIGVLWILVISCADTVDTIRYENPPSLIDVKRQLTVSVESIEKEPLTNFGILIDGPVSASTISVTESSYILDEITSGRYSISITKEGYLSTAITRDILVPEDVSSSFSVDVTIRLNEVEPPVTVDADEDATVDVAPSSSSASEGELTTLTVPANSFPEELVDESGQVEISVTRSTPSDVIQTQDGVVQDIFTFDFPNVDETYPITFNQAIGISIPVNLPDDLLQKIEAVGELRYKIVSPSAGGTMSTSGTNSTHDLWLSITGENNAQLANLVNGQYNDSLLTLPSPVIELVPNLDLTISSPPVPEAPVTVASAGCGEGIDTSYTWTSGLPADSFVFLYSNSVPEQKESSVLVEAEGVPNLKLTARVVRFEYTADLFLIDTNGNRTFVERVKFRDTSAEVLLSSVNCHNSGGG